jgi:hypothetical protein
VVTTMDPKLTGHKEVDRPNSGPRTPKDVPPSDRSTTVVGRDLQALRDVLSLHLVDPRRGGAESYMLRDIGIENRMEIAGLMRGRRYME